MRKIYKLLAVAMVLFCAVTKAQPVMGVTDFAVNGTISWNTNSPCVATKTANVQGWLVSVNSTSNCGINQSNSGGGDGRLQYLVGFGTLTQASFGSDNGSDFALVSLSWGASTSSFTTKSINFVGYRNGLPVSGATLNATTGPIAGPTNSYIVNFSGNPNFANVDNILMIPTETCSSILYFDHITIGTASLCTTSPTVSTVGSSPVSCNGGSNGTATVSATGAAPFSYAWSPSGGTSASASGLSSGIYTCVVTNSCAISVSQTINISQPTSLVTSTAVTNVACNGGSNGVAAITASGGTGTKTYLWSNGGTTSAITGLMAGVYTATVTDANGCKSIKSANVTQPSALVTTTAVTNVACNGGSNGVGSITASGGAGGYSYLWSNGATTSAITGQLAGIKTVTVTDANSCTSIKSVNIAQPSALVTTTAITSVACNGGSNGVASITASGGAGGYSYLWSNGGSTSAITGLMAGVYTATVTDANSCTSIKSAIITQPSALVTTTALTNVACNGGSNGVGSITASGGTSGYTYLWSNGGSTSALTGLMAGIYTATVTDANSCTSIKSVNITQPSAIVTTTALTGVLCNGGTGSATITASGGAGGFTYLWSNSASTSVISGALAGVYTATVTDANSCTSIKSVNITQPPVLLAGVSASSILCNGGVATLTVSAVGGTPSYAGTGTYTMFAGSNTYTVSDANGCTATTSISVSQPAVIAFSQTTSVCAGQSFTVGITTYTASGIYTNTLVSVIGCDSLVTTDLTVQNPINVSTTLNGVVISANNTSANFYQWLDCNNSNQAISGATVSAFTASANGNYAVSITQNGCTDTSACVAILTTGIKSQSNNISVSILPNPNNGQFVIDLPVEAGIEIIDASGKLIYLEKLNAGKQTISLNDAKTGIYFVKITTRNKQLVKKIVIEK